MRAARGRSRLAARAAPERAGVRRDRARASPWPASRATSRRRSTARPATSGGSARTPTAPGASCSRTPGRTCPSPPRGCSRPSRGASEDRVDYALEAAIFVTGAAVQWLRDALGIIRTADETEELARSLDSNDGVYLVPAFTGLGSPHWDPYARGTLVGLTRGAGRAHLAAGGARGDGLPDRRRGPGDGAGLGRSARGAEGRRRRRGQRLADEVPGRRAGRAGGGAGDIRDDRAGRRVPRRRGHGLLVGVRRALDVAPGGPLRALDVGGPARDAAGGLGAGARAGGARGRAGRRSRSRARWRRAGRACDSAADRRGRSVRTSHPGGP